MASVYPHALFIWPLFGVYSLLVRRPVGSALLARNFSRGGTVASARFMVVHGVFVNGFPVPEWPGPGGVSVRGGAEPQAAWTSWRLVGANHRELGRASRVFADIDACNADVVALIGYLDAAVMTLSKSASYWTWNLSREGETVAVASRGYQRQHECEYNGRVFLTTAPTAVRPGNYVVPHPRLDLTLGATTE